ncbi:MAG: helix-turn-helix domain-containing protein [Planctomycetes bacterium]|nr:helix-turn-helix domain-containing protein [Planctomycetota bacterium]
MYPALTHLERLLRTRLWIANVQVHAYADGFRIGAAIVPTPRLLLARAGSARYTVEGRAFAFRRGDMLFVPARTKRSWRVPAGGRFSVAWIEFTADHEAEFGGPHLLRRNCDLRLEAASIERLRRRHVLNDSRNALLAEGELKAVLARFFVHAEGPAAGRTAERAGRTFGEQAILKAMDWLGRHYAEPDALDGLPERVGLSPNHFRLLFRRHFGLSAQRCLTALRMRAARAMLQETARPVKEVARATGYRDPLFFSRHYRAFWKRSPARDRAFSP